RRAEEERAAGELARRTEQIKGVVTPVQERLTRMESEIGRLERERRQAHGELAEMVRHLGEGVGTLSQEAGNLATALKRPATRGSWGEIQLRNVVEMAGMVSHCDFVEQSTIHTDDGRLRPDMLVRDRKRTRLHSSHGSISYAVFCLKKKKMAFMELTNLRNQRIWTTAGPPLLSQ